MVIILRCKNASKSPSPIAKNSIKSNEETHQSPHVVCVSENSETMWSSSQQIHGQTMWSEQRIALHSFFRRCCIVTLVKGFVKPFSQFVCYSSVVRDELNAIYRIRNSGMQGRFEIKIRTQKLIRSKQRKSSLRPSLS